ncbi:septation protein SepH [Leucobacter ruminantium]|uniref:DUF3071 domain-containing protein n=1 Tax=Leucobacter ruminantium TaxID=1289170 RepID=A0A939LY18_9MICO|nr:septation protein SepH [Leucobacter ruminantium]MBO1806206.1 DUF3071 domain-containing protein [Leucobacter ruminantium]
MDELRFVRRDERALIVANDAGEEFRLLVDEAVLSELRHLGRRERDVSRIRPREIQALIRSGKTRSQVAEETGLEEADIERYEEPVLAERRYILERAHAVAVRAEAHDEDEQSFGAVIGARLVTLGADASEWSSWKEDQAGWMIGLEFLSHDTAHRAVWSFDHRKGVLSPLNTDAVNLSKQGDVGDRLIPKLRAVDSSEPRGRFDSGAFDPSHLAAKPQEGDEAAQRAPEDREGSPVPEQPSEAAQEDPDAEYERRREIEQRAMKTDSAAGSDLSQTADLLDALRRRRGERERSLEERGRGSDGAERSSGGRDETAEPTAFPGNRAEHPDEHPSRIRPAESGSPRPQAPRATQDPSPDTAAAPRPRSIWAAGGVSREAGKPRPADAPVEPVKNVEPVKKKDVKSEQPKKGRASIPSWDDILFGTRSDEDPA